MIDKIIKHVKRILKNNNIIRKRIIISFIYKLADFITDLKSIQKFKKFFTTKEQAEDKLNELRKNKDKIHSEDIDWYETTLDMVEFYVYQDPPIGVVNLLYGKCCILEFLRRGYDDPVCLIGLYPVDNDGNISGTLIGYKTINGTIDDGIKNICDFGIRGYGKLFITNKEKMYNFEQLKQYTQQYTNK